MNLIRTKLMRMIDKYILKLCCQEEKFCVFFFSSAQFTAKIKAKAFLVRMCAEFDLYKYCCCCCCGVVPHISPCTSKVYEKLSMLYVK